MSKVYSQATLHKHLSKELLQSLADYIQQNFSGDDIDLLSPVFEETIRYQKELEICDYEATSCVSTLCDKTIATEKYRLEIPQSRKPESSAFSLETAVAHLEDSFQKRLFYLIDCSGMTDAEVYKRAVVSRQNFSKIRNNENYIPHKNTALRLAIALELNLDQTNDLLRRAGYTLSPSCRADVIVQYFIDKKEYDIDLINMALYKMNEATIF